MTYFPATSPGDVTNDLGIIMTQILAQSQSTASAAVNSTGLNNNSIVYQSQFVTSDADQDWTGNLYAFTINAQTGVVDTTLADAVWSAQTQLDLQTSTSRLIDTWDPVAAAPAPFEWTIGTPTRGIASSTVGASTLGRKSLSIVSFSNMSVLTVVGCTALTRMPCGASSVARLRMMPTTPCLAAA